MRFRPLAGISCFLTLLAHNLLSLCFRPLAGISCFSLHGIRDTVYGGFRPLAGISCFRRSLAMAKTVAVFVP